MRGLFALAFDCTDVMRPPIIFMVLAGIMGNIPLGRRPERHLTMIKFNAADVGVDAGDMVLFSDFEDDGPMWSQQGPRIARQTVSFSENYARPPSVTVTMSMLDMSNEGYTRADIQAENVSETGFEIVFRTWGDSKVARVRAAWQSIGELPSDEQWVL